MTAMDPREPAHAPAPAGGCPHPQYRCLRCGHTGCDTRPCDQRGFHAGLCRQCGHFEKVRT